MQPTQEPQVTDTLAQLSAWHPTATRVFHRHGLDFCCGGSQSLADACQAAGLDAAAIAGELERAASTSTDDKDWANEAVPELIEHLLSAFHADHRDELPRLVEMAQKVERVHADKPDCPHGLANHLSAMLVALEDHMQKEEQVLFPMVLAGRGAMAGMPIACMETEHQEHGENLRKMKQLAADYVVPEGACNTWRALIEGTHQLEHDLMQHIHLENNVLFPRVLSKA